MPFIPVLGALKRCQLSLRVCGREMLGTGPRTLPPRVAMATGCRAPPPSSSARCMPGRRRNGTGRGGAAAPQRRREVPPVRYRAAGPGWGSVSFPSLTPLPALPYNKKLRRQRGVAGGCAGRRSVVWRGGRARAGRAGPVVSAGRGWSGLPSPRWEARTVLCLCIRGWLGVCRRLNVRCALAGGWKIGVLAKAVCFLFPAGLQGRAGSGPATVPLTAVVSYSTAGFRPLFAGLESCGG